MSLIVDDSYAYKGSVKISYKKNGEMRVFEYDNSGTALLFKTLARAMIGISIYSLVPSLMEITESSDGTGASFLKKPLVITRRAVNEELSGNSKVFPAVFTALLNLADLKSSALSGEREYYLSLRGGEIDGTASLPLAVVELDREVIEDISLNRGIQALIEWKMIFNNKE